MYKQLPALQRVSLAGDAKTIPFLIDRTQAPSLYLANTAIVSPAIQISCSLFMFQYLQISTISSGSRYSFNAQYSIQAPQRMTIIVWMIWRIRILPLLLVHKLIGFHRQ